MHLKVIIVSLALCFLLESAYAEVCDYECPAGTGLRIRERKTSSKDPTKLTVKLTCKSTEDNAVLETCEDVMENPYVGVEFSSIFYSANLKTNRGVVETATNININNEVETFE